MAASTNEPAQASRRRGRSRIVLPAVVVVLAAIAWSGFWVVASRQAEARLDAFLADEAAKGRVVTCSNRQMGGFPFRLELRCVDPRVEVTRDDGSYSIAAKDFAAVAQVYDPMHVIAEASGPLVVSPIGGRGPLDAAWKSAEASIQFSLSGPQRVSIVVDGLTLAQTVDGERQPIVEASQLEAHTRASEGAGAEPGSYDVVARLNASDVPSLDRLLGEPQPAKVEFQGTVTGLTDLSAKPLVERLREWSQAGGQVKVTLLRVDRGATSASAAGEVALDADGHPVGRLNVSLSGVKELSRALKQAGVAPPNLGNLLGVGLTLLGKPTNIDGKPAVEVPLTMAKGRASVGAFPAGETPKFF